MCSGAGHHFFAERGIRARVTVEFCLRRNETTIFLRADFDAETTPQGIVLADFNSDGNLDAATANNVQPGYIRLFFGNGRRNLFWRSVTIDW